MKRQRLTIAIASISTVILFLALSSVLACSQPVTAPAAAPTAAPATAAQPAPANVINLGFATKWPEPSAIVQWVYMPVLNEIVAKSKGRISFTMYGNAVLGKADDHYDLARTGKVDIAEFSHGYMPGRFPLTDVLTLPMSFEHTLSTAQAIQAIFQRSLIQEYPDTHILDVHRTEHFYLQSNIKVRTLEDLKGRKIRDPGGLTGPCLKALGAEPLLVPVTDLYLALQTGVIDAASSGVTAVPSFKLNEVVKYVILFNFGCTPSGVVMNSNSWQKLPDDLKKLVGDTFLKIGVHHALFAAGFIPDCLEMIAKGRGAEAIWSLSPQEEARFAAVLKPVVTNWISDLKAQGKPIEQTMNIAREECKKAKVTFPW